MNILIENIYYFFIYCALIYNMYLTITYSYNIPTLIKMQARKV